MAGRAGGASSAGTTTLKDCYQQSLFKAIAKGGTIKYAVDCPSVPIAYVSGPNGGPAAIEIPRGARVTIDADGHHVALSNYSSSEAPDPYGGTAVVAPGVRSFRVDGTLTLKGVDLDFGHLTSLFLNGPHGGAAFLVSRTGTLNLVGGAITRAVVQGSYGHNTIGSPDACAKDGVGGYYCTNMNVKDGGNGPPAGGGGDAKGGAIYNQGTLNIKGTRFVGNEILGGRGGSSTGGAGGPDSIGWRGGRGGPGGNGGSGLGGAIFNERGKVVIVGATFDGNLARGGDGGASIGGRGGCGVPSYGARTEFCGSHFMQGRHASRDTRAGLDRRARTADAVHGGSGGAAGDATYGGFPGVGVGGAIVNHGGAVTISSSVLSGNAAYGGTGRSFAGAGGDGGFGAPGQGPGCAGSDPVTGDCNSWTPPTDGAPGGFAGDGGAAYPLTREGGNAQGGAIYSEGRLSISKSLFSKNSAHGGRGAASLGGPGGPGGDGGQPGCGFEGAHTVCANYGPGGLGGDGGSGVGAAGGDATGGGVYVLSGVLGLNSVTFSANTVVSGKGALGSGGIGGIGGFGAQSGSGGKAGANGRAGPNGVARFPNLYRNPSVKLIH